jgi:hypothetical protein
MSLTGAQRPANRRERYRLMADAATRPFAVGSVAVPLILPILGYLSADVRVMFTVHLFLGAFWFGTAVLGAVVLGPVMGSLSEEANAEFAEGFVPKMNLLMEPISVGVIGSGISLASMMGLWKSRHRHCERHLPSLSRCSFLDLAHFTNSQPVCSTKLPPKRPTTSDSPP